jgi:RNA polymerase sigma-70 factor (ECF subfamily)
MSNHDPQRFTALIAPHLDAIFRAAYRLSRNRADADDLVQETCVRAFLSIGQLRETQPVKAWLLRVMHNLFVDGVRRARLAPVPQERDGESPGDSAESPEPSPEVSAYTTQREELLQRAWLKLEAGHRALLALKAEGYTLAEIGEITGLPTDALTARLYRARQNFSRHLTAEQGFASAMEMEIAK